MGKLLGGMFVGVFLCALAYELLKETKVVESAARSVSEYLQSAKTVFKEGYQSAAQQS